MRGKARLLAALAAFALVLGPALAEARPGGRSSMGSRGSQTFSPPPATRTAPDAARPMDRTMTQPNRPGTAAPGAAAPGAAAPQRGGMFGGGFGGALMGGLIGMGIGGLLFGNGLFGGFGGFGSILGLLLQIGLIVLLVRFAIRFFRSRNQPAMAGGPRPDSARPEAMHRAAQPGPRPMGMGMGGARPAPATVPVQVGQSDFQAFESLLRDVNAAWSARDPASLSRLATPEMMGFFSKDWRDLEARGWRNETRDVRLEQGDLAEAWREGDTEYATVAMRFSLIDVTYDAQGRVVEGDPNRRDVATELWTFTRGPAGSWKLSAIQQTG